MFAPFFRWLESRIDVFAPFDEGETPPRGVWPSCGTTSRA